MSNALAIAAVTKALRQLLLPVAGHTGPTWDVTTLPPDLASENPPGNRLNVFLYHTTVDAAWRNQDLPTVRPGQTAFPPLPLVLHYVITAYGDRTTTGDKDDILAHEVLGRAMSVLHDHPLLGPQDFALSGSDLGQQVERVRITPQPLTVDEMYRLWMAFQTKYRISAAYEVSVVLIDSVQPVRVPPPVLQPTIGPTVGQNPAGTLPLAAFPALTGFRLPHNQPAALPGDEIVLTGQSLTGASAVSFTHPQLPMPLSVTPGPLTDTELTVTVPAGLPAGINTTMAAIFSPPDRPSNPPLPLAVAPQITTASFNRDSATNDATVQLDCLRPVFKGQQVVLLLDGRQFAAAPLGANPTTTLSFSIPAKAVLPGDYLVHLRVDDVDDLPQVDWTDTGPTFHGPLPTVTVT